MNGRDFLHAKGVLDPEATGFHVTYPDGRTFELGAFLDEFKALKEGDVVAPVEIPVVAMPVDDVVDLKRSLPFMPPVRRAEYDPGTQAPWSRRGKKEGGIGPITH